MGFHPYPLEITIVSSARTQERPSAPNGSAVRAVSRAVGSLVTCGALIALGVAHPGTAGAVTVPGVITAEQLAVAVEDINQRSLDGSAATTSAESLVAGFAARNPAITRLPSTRLGLTREAARVADMAGRLKADGRVVVKSVDVTVDSQKTERGVRFVNLKIVRRLGDGQAWEEITPYAVVEQTTANSGVTPGLVVPVDREAVENGVVPDQLAGYAGVTRIDDTEMLDPGAVVATTPSAATAADAASTVPPKGGRPAMPGGVSVMALSSTNRLKVKNYALKHALSPNSAYHLWSVDCTNFVSQAMRAGGWAMDTGWYRSDSNWWYTGNVGIKASWTWAGAENWYRFARVESGRTSSWSNVYSLREGDILQYKLSGSSTMTHSMVTTGHSNGVPLLSYHTTNTKNKPFTAMTTTGRTWFAHKV